MNNALVALAAGLSAATVHEAAGRTGAFPSAIKPLWADAMLCGPAYPVRSAAGDNLGFHHAIYAAEAGDILVVDCGDASEYGYWGEVMARAAQEVGIAGLVTSGGVRDSRRMVEIGFPVFAANVCIRGTGKDPSGAGSLGQPITIGEVRVARGDLVIGDADGIVVVEAALAAAVIAEARRRDASEQAIFDQLRAGATTLEIYQLPPLARR